MVVVLEEVGYLLLKGQGAVFGDGGGGEGGGVVGGPDARHERGGFGGVVENQAFGLAALAVIFEAGRGQRRTVGVGMRCSEGGGGGRRGLGWSYESLFEPRSPPRPIEIAPAKSSARPPETTTFAFP